MRLLFGKALFVGNIATGAVVFSLFANWYDTGQSYTSSDDLGAVLVVVGGVIFGWIGTILEERLFSRYGFWPKNKWFFFMRQIAISIVWIGLSFSTLIGLLFSIDRLLHGAGGLETVVALIIIPIMTLVYSMMILPFALVVGVVNGVILRVTNGFRGGQNSLATDTL